ncbi:MAG: PDGLE domain-containing protein [Gemmatirosa sp.]
MSRIPTRLFVVVAIAVAVGLPTAVSPVASSSPDGLEKVATDKAFIDDGELHRLQEESPIPDYAFPGIENERVATGVAGFVGTLGVFAAASGLGYVLRRRGAPSARSATTLSS